MRVGIFGSGRVASTPPAVTEQWMQYSTSQQANISLSTVGAVAAGDVVVALDIGNYTDVGQHGTAMSGLGATWSYVTGGQSLIGDAWVASVPSGLSSGQTVTLTAPGIPIASRRRLVLYCFRGVTATVDPTVATGSSTTVTATDTAGAGKAVIVFGYSDTSADSLKSLVPASGWAAITNLDIISASRWAGLSSRIPSTTESHSASASRASGSTFATMLVVG